MTRACADCDKVYDQTAMYEIRRPTLVSEEMMRTRGQTFRQVHRFWLCTNCWDKVIGGAALMLFR